MSPSCCSSSATTRPRSWGPSRQARWSAPGSWSTGRLSARCSPAMQRANLGGGGDVMLLLLASCGERFLSPEQRAAEIRVLADGHTDEEDEAKIVALLGGARPEDLRMIKRRLDVGEEDLHHIVYSDIDD